MTTKPNNKILLLIIGILLLTNISMLLFFINSRPAERRGMRSERKAMMTAFLQKEIGFSQQQLQQYDSLNALHRSKVKTMFEDAGKEKENQFKQLAASNFSDSSINVNAGLAAGKQKEIEVEIFANVKNIRSICTPEQQPKFDSLFYPLLNKRMGDRKK
jgi:protein CpxP